MIKKSLHLLTGILLFCSMIAKSQTTVRGMYVNGFSTILGNQVKEDSLLNYAKDSSFNYLALYELHRLSLSTNTTNATNLANFIQRAKSSYGIQFVGAVGESLNFFQNTIVPYNNSRSNISQKFNVFNVEFEFWSNASTGTGGYYCNQYLQPSGCNCDTSGAFSFYMNLIRKVDSLAALQNVISETYLGWFNQGQAQQITRVVDRILLHSYRVDETTLYSYAKTRLQYLAANQIPVNVIGLYSAEPVFMGPWLQSHPEVAAFNKYRTDYTNDNNTWKQYINLQGYQWFAYGFLPKPTPAPFVASISASGDTIFCQGDSVILTASAGTTYQWSNGATTPSVTIKNSGSYKCIVSSGNAIDTTNVITVLVNEIPALTISQGTVSNNTITLSANTTAFNGSVSAYTWYLEGNVIAGANTSQYSANTSGNYTASIVTSSGCSTRSTPINVVIPVTSITPTPVSCTITIPTNLRATYIDGISELLSWNSIPYCDSIGIRLSEDKTNSNTLIYIPFQSNFTYVLQNLRANKKYTWRMRTFCGGNASAYSQKNSFSTFGSAVMRDEFADSESISTASMVNVYPNPATETITIHLDAESNFTQMEIINSQGKCTQLIPISELADENSIVQNISDLSAGLYFIRLSNSDFSQTIRLMKMD